MKQTAVEWLGKELESYGDPGYCKLEWETLDSLIQQAKETEKEQIGYSEEEVERIVHQLMNDVHCGDICHGENVIDFKISPKKWFERFKNK